MKLKWIFIAFGTTIFSSCTLQNAELGLNILNTFAAVGTLIIAAIAYDKFGLKRSRKIKEVELAREFYEKLKEVLVQGKTNQKLELEPGLEIGKSEVTLMIRPFENMDHFLTEELKNREVIFTSAYNKYFTEEIGKIVQNIFFPEKLLSRFKFIEHDISQALLVEHEWNLDKYIYLKTNETPFEKTFPTFPIGIQPLKFQHVLNNYKKLKIETENYLNENGYRINNHV